MTLRERLRRAEQRLASLRDDRAAKRTQYDQAAEALANAPEDAGPDHEAFAASRTAREELEAVQAEIERAEGEQTELLRQLALDQRPDDQHGGGDEGEGPAGTQRFSVETLRAHREEWHAAPQRIVQEEPAREVARLAHTRSAINRVSLGRVSREAFASELDRGDLAGLVQPDRRGLVAPVFQPLTFLDFLPWTGTDSNSVQYVQATQMPHDGPPVSPTPEGDLKPEMGPLKLEDVDAHIRTIAAWTIQKKQVLADAPFLAGLLQQLLNYEVKRALQAQVISGDGEGENLLGLMQHDILSYTRGEESETENEADAIAWGIAKIEQRQRNPAVVLLNPMDIWELRLMRERSGGADDTGAYVFGPPSQPGASTIWNRPMLPEASLARGETLVADPQCALGLLRSGVEMLASDSDGDNFRRNRVTLLGELRAGLAVMVTDGFCRVDIKGSEQS